MRDFRMAKTAESKHFYLAYSFTGNTKYLTDCFERFIVVIIQTEDLFFSIRKLINFIPQFVNMNFIYRKDIIAINVSCHIFQVIVIELSIQKIIIWRFGFRRFFHNHPMRDPAGFGVLPPS